jgi:sugar lactone lactonase YvrE
MLRRTLAIVALATLAVTAAAPAASAGPKAAPPVTLRLPAGFQPEGIAVGKTPFAFLGSRADGDIYRVSLLTGEGKVIFQGPGTPSLGLKADGRGRLFVAGGTGGDARVLDTFLGKPVKSYRLQAGAAFINDVTLTGGAAWFTDSANPALFALTFGRSGTLPDEATKIPLTGDIVYKTGNNANGITSTPDGRALIIVQSNTGKLFRTTYAGVTHEIDLGGQTVPDGDGLWLRGDTLYVAQNRPNLLTKITLDSSARTGKVVSRTTNAGFDTPTTIAEWNSRLYLPNARFTTAATPTTPYAATAVPIP